MIRPSALALVAIATLSVTGCGGGADPVAAETVAVTTTMTATVTAPPVTKTVEAAATNEIPEICLEALTAADTMGGRAGEMFGSFGTVMGAASDALRAASRLDQDALDAATEIITAENEKIDADAFARLVEDYSAKRDRCRAEAG